jgi:hypothetical protein
MLQKSNGTKYVIARNAWCAKHLMNRINDGRAPVTLLMNSRTEAQSKFRRLSEMKREELNIFEVTFHDKKR